MKISAVALALSLSASTWAFAGDVPPGNALVALRQIVPYMEARYQGEVVAVALDSWGDKAAHYHVQLRFPDAGMVKLDVNASTLEISLHDKMPLSSDWIPLPNAAAQVARQFRGEVIAAELDASDPAAAHYDVDVRLPGGKIAQLKIDPKTRQLAWRTPPLVAD